MDTLKLSLRAFCRAGVGGYTAEVTRSACGADWPPDEKPRPGISSFPPHPTPTNCVSCLRTASGETRSTSGLSGSPPSSDSSSLPFSCSHQVLPSPVLLSLHSVLNYNLHPNCTATPSSFPSIAAELTSLFLSPSLAGRDSYK